MTQEVTGIDSLRNVLELERRKGYTDKAVIGGLDKYLHKQAGQIRESINDPRLLSAFNELNLARSNYGSYSVDERKRWIAGIFGWLDKLQEPTEVNREQKPPVSSQKTAAARLGKRRKEGLDSPITIIRGISTSIEKRFAKLNVRTVNDLLEHFPAEKKFDCIISRAFTDIKNFLALALPLVKRGGIVVAMKGRTAAQELSAAEAVLVKIGMQIHSTRSFLLPANGGARTTSCLKNVSRETSKDFLLCK